MKVWLWILQYDWLLHSVTTSIMYEICLCLFLVSLQQLTQYSTPLHAISWRHEIKASLSLQLTFTTPACACWHTWACHWWGSLGAAATRCGPGLRAGQEIIHVVRCAFASVSSTLTLKPKHEIERSFWRSHSLACVCGPPEFLRPPFENTCSCQTYHCARSLFFLRWSGSCESFPWFSTYLTS